MAYYEYLWSDEPGDNVEHIAQHGLTPDDFEFVFENFEGKAISNTTGMALRFGYTEDGRHIVVVFEWADDEKSLFCLYRPIKLQKGTAEMSKRREPTAEQKKRMKDLIVQESRPEVMAANRAQIAQLRAGKNETLAKQTLALLLEEKDRQQISLAQLEERCGIARGNLSKLWNDPDPNATLATVERIAMAMGVKVLVSLSK